MPAERGPSGTGREYPPELVHGELCATRFSIQAECDCGKESELAPAERGPSGTGHDTAEIEGSEGLRGDAAGTTADVRHEAVEQSPSGVTEAAPATGWVGLQRPTRVAHAPEPDPAADPVVSPADTRHVLLIRFRERENAEKAREQIVWAMERAQLVPFHIEIEEIDRGF